MLVGDAWRAQLRGGAPATSRARGAAAFVRVLPTALTAAAVCLLLLVAVRWSPGSSASVQQQGAAAPGASTSLSGAAYASGWEAAAATNLTRFRNRCDRLRGVREAAAHTSAAWCGAHAWSQRRPLRRHARPTTRACGRCARSLLAEVVPTFSTRANGTVGMGLGDWDLFAPVLSCPPRRPVQRYGRGTGARACAGCLPRVSRVCACSVQVMRRQPVTVHVPLRSPPPPPRCHHPHTTRRWHQAAVCDGRAAAPVRHLQHGQRRCGLERGGRCGACRVLTPGARKAGADSWTGAEGGGGGRQLSCASQATRGLRAARTSSLPCKRCECVTTARTTQDVTHLSHTPHVAQATTCLRRPCWRPQRVRFTRLTARSTARAWTPPGTGVWLAAAAAAGRRLQALLRVRGGTGAPCPACLATAAWNAWPPDTPLEAPPPPNTLTHHGAVAQCKAATPRPHTHTHTHTHMHTHCGAGTTSGASAALRWASSLAGTSAAGTK
jgi:hypothetical protein